ncbi:MAG TPA: phosphotransferase [Streptosporangiaceae bacterium]|nr:phosphotransferase [Streptosporangiaceae bacterium]
MDGERTRADRQQLAGLLREALGRHRQLSKVERLRGGSKKGVYRATFDDDVSAIVYIWGAAEDYWSGSAATASRDRTDPLSHASGLDLFETAQARLDFLGVRTPRLYLADRSQEYYPADVAVVEDIPGPTLEDLLRDDPQRGRSAVVQVGQALDIMRGDKAPCFGKLQHVASGGISAGDSCEQVVLERALRDLTEAEARDARFGPRRNQIEQTLRQGATAALPRCEYTLIHGELGPDHVLVDRQGNPVIIDIEGLMYFDVEWEHVFLRLRFGRHYPLLPHADLDQERVDFYRLAMHLSLVAGPLRLLDGDYPDRQEMLEIIECNALQVLAPYQRLAGA